jgi:AcrR family transcriptional regulator
MNRQSTSSRRTSGAQTALARARRAPGRSRSSARSTLRGAVAGVVRKTILEAAETVFGERGFADAKMAEVARRAGVAAGTLYNYFDSKESMFRALIEHRAEEFMGGLEAIAAGGAAGQPGARRGERARPHDPLAQLERLTEATFAYVESHAAVFLLFEQIGGSAGMGARRACGPSGESLRGRYLQLFQGILSRAVRAGRVRGGLPIDDLALIYAGGVQGLMRGWLLDGRPGRLTDRTGLLLSVFLQGAGKRSPTTRRTTR